MNSEAEPVGRPRQRPRIRTIVIVICAVLILAIAWVGVRALLARGELERALPAAQAARDAVLAGDTDAASTAIDELESRVGAAERLTSDPVFAVASAVPWAGANLGAFRTVITSLDDVTQNGLVPLADDAGSIGVDSLLPVDGRVDIETLESVAPALADADAAFIRALDDVRGVDTSRVIPPIAEAVDELESVLSDASAIVAAGSRAADLLPAALGADGDRNYVLVFQNNAEVRATGGLPGSLALVSTSDGRFDLTTQASAESFPTYPSPVVDVDSVTQSLYGGLTARFMQNANLTPDFPTAARVITEMWQQQYGVEVDGVIAVDPVFLSYLLEASGPVELSTGDVIDSDNAVDFLLSEVYSRYTDPETQDIVFADAASAVFDTLSNGSLEPTKLAAAMVRGSDERRILLWNTRADEQSRIDGTTFAGGLPDTNRGATTVGVFFNDATGAKLDVYLDAEVDLAVDSCGDGAADAAGISEFATTVRLSSDVPLDAATSLPERVTGGGFFGVEPGTVRTRVVVYGPVDGRVESVEVDSQPAEAQSVVHLGRPAVQVVVDLVPGASASVDVGFAVDSDDAGSAPALTVTPLIDAVPMKISSRECGARG